MNVIVFPEAKLYTQSQYQIFEEVVPEVDLDVINEIKPSFQKNSNQTVRLNQVEEKLNVDTMETAGADSHLTGDNRIDKLAKYLNNFL